MILNHHSDLPRNLRFLVVVTSDSIANKISKGEQFLDKSGDFAINSIKAAKHTVVDRLYLPNDISLIREAIRGAALKGMADIILISGGTGPGPRDVTVEAIRPLFEKELPGFGELFRQMSYEKVGTPAIASRATAGVINGVVVFALPGSPDAVKLAIDKIILPESPHLVKMVRGSTHA
ncbi:MAG: molybdenum cofactor biosynthesis protein MoaB [Candidatus Verstraetearchaeota archaeon]|nr:molybdenum cofactor biosynthesis protein MoaB [Candidatus Verstraetearchaeota archaeon]